MVEGGLILLSHQRGFGEYREGVPVSRFRSPRPSRKHNTRRARSTGCSSVSSLRSRLSNNNLPSPRTLHRVQVFHETYPDLSLYGNKRNEYQVIFGTRGKQTNINSGTDNKPAQLAATATRQNPRRPPLRRGGGLRGVQNETDSRPRRTTCHGDSRVHIFRLH